MATNDEITKILAILAATYPRFKLTSETVAAYVQFLGDIPAETLKVSAMKCATTCNFFPSVYELRQAVSDLIRASNKIPNTFEAWHIVNSPPFEEEVSYAYHDPDGNFYTDRIKKQWGHPLVEKAARLLGWPKEFPGTNPSTDRAHFIKAYDALLAEELSQSVELPEITSFIEGQRNKQLEAGSD